MMVMVVNGSVHSMNLYDVYERICRGAASRTLLYSGKRHCCFDYLRISVTSADQGANLGQSAFLGEAWIVAKGSVSACLLVPWVLL